MIHDASVEVTCDGDRCTSNEWIPLPWMVGGYDADDNVIEDKLEERGWVVRDGQHFYCEGCAGQEPTK